MGHVISKIVILGVGMLVAGCVWFVVQVLYGWMLGALVGGLVMLAVVFLLVILPRIIKPTSSVPKLPDDVGA